MDRKAVLAYLGEDWDRTMERIDSSLKSDISLLNKINESLLEHSGKMLRPMLSLLTAKAFCEGPLPEDSIRFAAASELLHNATLLHDDVADQSDMRRGQPTVNRMFGGTASVLVGDFWLVKAVDNILSADKNASDVIRIFAKTLTDLAEGEMLQMQKAVGGDTSEADYIRIIYSKTASLFEAACTSAAISAGTDGSMLAAVREYAINLGLAFQIKDDILDYAGDDIGKPVGVDLKEQKITIPLLGALHNVSDEHDRQVRRMVCEIPAHPENCERIHAFVLENGGLEYARTKLGEFVSRAEKALGQLPDGAATAYLGDVAEYFIDRKI